MSDALLVTRGILLNSDGPEAAESLVAFDKWLKEYLFQRFVQGQIAFGGIVPHDHPGKQIPATLDRSCPPPWDFDGHIESQIKKETESKPAVKPVIAHVDNNGAKAKTHFNLAKDLGPLPEAKLTDPAPAEFVDVRAGADQQIAEVICLGEPQKNWPPPKKAGEPQEVDLLKLQLRAQAKADQMGISVTHLFVKHLHISMPMFMRKAATHGAIACTKWATYLANAFGTDILISG